MHTNKMLATSVTGLFVIEKGDEKHLICSDAEYAENIGYKPFYLWQGRLDTTEVYRITDIEFDAPALDELVTDSTKLAPKHLAEQIKGE